jgi:hypothetical protein
MKKIIAFVATILVFNFIHAQQKTVRRPLQPPAQPKPQPPQAWLGIFAGPHLNFLDYYDKVATIEGTNTNFHAGIFYQKNINKNFALQPELLFSIRGGKINNIDSAVNISLMNIELPVNFLFLYKQLMMGAGPYFAYGIKGKLKGRKDERNVYDATASFERTLKRYESGGNFMIGYTFKKGIFITAQFAAGLTDIYKGDGSAPHNVHAKTRVFGLSLGYRFEIPKEE